MKNHGVKQNSHIRSLTVGLLPALLRLGSSQSSIAADVNAGSKIGSPVDHRNLAE